MCILYDNVHVSIWYSLPSVNHKSEANGCNSLDNCNRCKIDVMQIGTMHIESTIQEKICTEAHLDFWRPNIATRNSFPWAPNNNEKKFRFRVNVVFCNLNCLASHERANDEEKKTALQIDKYGKCKCM